jgi:hypothetical protein
VQTQSGEHDGDVAISCPEASKQPGQGKVNWFRRDLFGPITHRRECLGNFMRTNTFWTIERVLEELAQGAKMWR